MVPYDHTTEDIIRTAHYVPSAERGNADQPTLTAEEVLAQLEDHENSLVQVEAESNARFGTVYSRGLEENEMSVQQIEREVTELTSTGIMGTKMEGGYSVQERLRQLRTMLGDTGPRDNQRRTDFNVSNSLVTESNRPFIANRHGEAFADSNEGDFFPKTFPCLFPWGTGGPKNMTMSSDEEAMVENTEGEYGIEPDTQRSKNAFDLGQDFSYNGMVSKICLLLWIYTYEKCRWSVCHAPFVPVPYLQHVGQVRKPPNQ